VGIPDSNPDLTVASFLAIFRQRRSVIFWITGALVVLAAIYAIASKPHYKSTATIEVQRSSNDLLDLGSMMSQSSEIGDALNASLDLQTQVEILQSDTLALKVIKDLNLENTYDFKPHWSPIGAVLGLFSHSDPAESASVPLEDAPQRRSHAIAVFLSHLKVKPVAATRLIDVTYTNSDPKLAAAIVNDLDRSLMDYGLNVRNEETNQTSQWLGHQLSDLKQQAHDMQAKVVELQRTTGIYSLGEGADGRDQVYSSTLDQLQQATTSLTAATSSRIMKGALYDTIRNGDPEMISSLAGGNLTSSSTVQNSLTLLQNLRGQEATAAAQLAQDTSKFGLNYPKLADEQSNVASLDKAVKDEVARIGERARNDYQASVDTEKKLQAVYDDRKTQASKLNDRAIEYGIAKQEADNSRNLYEDLSKRLGEAGVIEGLRSSNISVVSSAKDPSRPSPNSLLYVLAALGVGLILGSFVALFVDIMDPTIRTFRVAENALGLSFFAVLPLYASEGLLARILPEPVKRLLLRNGKGSTTLAVVSDAPGTAFAEAMRRLRFSLLSGRNGPPPKVILVTSAIPNEGKTTIAVNLAVLLGQAGKSVLLVEADLRQPGLPYSLGSTRVSDVGFSQLLSDSDRDAPSKPLTAVGGLQVLRSGPVMSNPTDLLSTNRAHILMDQWKNQFDHVVIDSPPLLDVADSLILSQLSDLTLLVSRYGFTPKRSLERAYQMLGEATDCKIDVVLNAVDRSSVSYDEYYGYNGLQYYQTN
jgi:polysaccharide biosynthesis transport protein